MASFTPPPIDYSLLKDRSAIVTGGASGLGYATAAKFASSGAWVTIADMQDEMGRQAAADLTAQGHKASFIHCDTTDWTSSDAAFRHATNFSPHKTLDIAALFAGTDGERKGLVDLAIQAGGADPKLDDNPLPEPAHRAVDVNLIGVYLSTFLALHYFRIKPAVPPAPATPAPKKSLIMISSMTGYIDLPYNTGYSVSKFGIRGLFRSIRSQTPLLSTRVNNILPAYLLTPLTRKVHQITSPDQPSRATGAVLPWAPVEYLVWCACHCATNPDVHGRSFAVQPSGFVDVGEDAENGYGGAGYVELLERDGFMKIPSLFPGWKGGAAAGEGGQLGGGEGRGEGLPTVAS